MSDLSKAKMIRDYLGDYSDQFTDEEIINLWNGSLLEKRISLYLEFRQLIELSKNSPLAVKVYHAILKYLDSNQTWGA